MHKKSCSFSLLIPIFLAGGLLTIYLSTMAPGLTWANAGADGGDLITAAVTGGVAHPTGYPTYLLFARAFQALPIGSLAYRTNLLSALATVLSAELVYWMVSRALGGVQHPQSVFGGLISGMAFGLAPLVWSQSVITEVYTLNALVVLLLLSLSTDSISVSWIKYASSLRGLLLGIGLGIHTTIILLAPIVLPANSLHWRDSSNRAIVRFFDHKAWQMDWKSFLKSGLWMLIGSSVYLLIPLWASSQPPVNWGAATSWSRGWWLVSGQYYRDYLGGLSPTMLWEHLHKWAVLLLGQFGLIGFLIGLIGLLYFSSFSRTRVIEIWMVILYSLFAINYNTSDWYVLLIPAFIPFSIWIGFGVAGLFKIILGHKLWLRWLFGILCLLNLLILGVAHWSNVDAAHDHRAEDFGREVLSIVPPHALVFAQEDQTSFALWYFRFALHQRSDITVIATDLMPFTWYQETLRASYPSLVFPKFFPWPSILEEANPGRPVCFVQYVEQTKIQCSETSLSRRF